MYQSKERLNGEIMANRVKAKADLRYVEIKFFKNSEDKKEHTCFLRLNTLKDSLKKFDEYAPNRIITNIEVLCSIEIEL